MIPPVPIAPREIVDEYRELTTEEIEQYVKPHYEASGNSLPDPRYATFVGIIRDGVVLASLGVQVKLHAQPLILSEGHANLLPRLVSLAEETILRKSGPQWVYLFAPAGKLTQLAQSMGMQLEPWCVLSKLVAPELPEKPPIELLNHENESVKFNVVATDLAKTYAEATGAEPPETIQ
jgi:hypothetical protein